MDRTTLEVFLALARPDIEEFHDVFEFEGSIHIQRDYADEFEEVAQIYEAVDVLRELSLELKTRKERAPKTDYLDVFGTTISIDGIEVLEATDSDDALGFVDRVNRYIRSLQ